MKAKGLRGWMILGWLALLLRPAAVIAAEDPVSEARRLHEGAVRLHTDGKYAEGVPVAEQAFEIRARVLGREHPDSVASLLSLANLQRDAGAYAAAESSYQQVIDSLQRVNGPDDAGLLPVLHGLATMYFKNNAFGKAEPLYERLIAICERTEGPQSIAVADHVSSLARLHGMTGAHAKALSLYLRALGIQQKILGVEHRDTAGSLSNIASMQQAMGNYDEAEKHHFEALAIREKILGAEHKDTAMSFYNLGNLYRITGDYAKSEARYRHAADMFEKIHGREHAITARGLMGLGELYRFKGEYDKAEPLLLRALRIREKVIGPEHPDTARSLGALGSLYFARGSYDNAASCMRRALGIFEKQLGREHPVVATALNDLGILSSFTGDYATAEAHYRRAIAIKEKVLGSGHVETVDSQINLGKMYQYTGDYANAEMLFRRALADAEKSVGPEHPTIAMALVNLGVTYGELGAYQQAEVMLERGVAMARNVFGSEHPETTAALAALAESRSVRRDFVGAELLYEQVLAIQEKSLGPEHPDQGYSLGRMADVYFGTRRYTAAGALYARARAIQKRSLGAEHPNTTYAGMRLALLNWTLGKRAEALALLRETQRAFAGSHERFLRYGSEARNRAYLQQRTERDFKNASLSFAVAMQGRDSTTLGLTSVLQYKGRVQEAATDSVGRLRRSVRAEDRVLFEKLAGIANRASVLAYEGARGYGGLTPDAYRRQLDELFRQQAALENELSRRSSEFARQVAPVTVSSVSRAMPADSVLVEWVRYDPFDPASQDPQTSWGPSRYAVYVLKPSGSATVVDLGPAADIERAVRDFQAAVSVRSRTDVKQYAAALTSKIMAPIRAQLTGVRHLLLSPDGALNLVPMAALLDENGRYLAERFDISYLTSGRDLLRFVDPEQALSSNAVIIADPDYDQQARVAQEDQSQLEAQRSADLDRGDISFRPLRGTALEAEAIRALLIEEGVRVFTQAQASETRLKQLHGPRILHLATHGFFLDDQELWSTTRRSASQPGGQVAAENSLLRSGLALAGANGRRAGFADDGILTALEASRLDLRGTELVVLSACETGIGEIKNGDGVSGLRRGLLMAGARSQISTLWKVSDLPTRDLMVNFYKNLVKGEGRAVAMRHAQQQMLASNQFAHPYYWASFVVIGAWAPLYQSP